MIINTISRMKPLISPSSISTFTPNLAKPISYIPLFSSLLSNNFNFKNPKNPRFFHAIKPTKIMSCLNSSTPNGAHNLYAQASQPSPAGEIHVIVGPMFAGKTSTLLHRVQAESIVGRSVAIIKSNKDTRYGLDSIVTHDGEKYPCWPLADLSLFKQKIGSDAYDKLEVIGIDEAQFFGDLYDFCSEVADYDGKTVIVAGLDGDYLRRRFGSVLDIIPIADSVTKLTARCQVCGKRASFTLRKTEETETEVIAGADKYMPVCRKHYVSGHVVKEKATVLEPLKVHCGSSL